MKGLGVVAHTFDHSTQEAEADWSLWDRDQPNLQSELQASWGYNDTLSQQNKTKLKWINFRIIKK